MKTVLDCLESGSRYLEDRGIENARRNMQWLVAHQLGCDRLELYLQFDRPMAEEELAPLRDILKRRGAGEPLQHLLGTVEFHRHEFRCDARALVPRPETEELVEQVLKLSYPRPARVLDVGTGSGVLGLSLALALGEECRELVLADVSSEALALARENAALHEVEAIFHEGDLLEGLPGPFDLIVANLPYISEGEKGSLSAEVRHDPPSALFAGADGLDLLRQFIPQAAGRLGPEGCLALEIGASQGAALLDLLGNTALDDARVVDDLSGNPRFVFAHAPHGS